jgi:hypothetical protein
LSEGTRRVDKEVFHMIDAKSRRTASGASRQTSLVGDAAAHDDEAQLAAALRMGDDAPARARERRRIVAGPPETKAGRVAAEIVETVEARLPGRIRDLQVQVHEDQFVLSGVSSSYYVKQMAQHVAMNALNALMLGRLVNDIKVHSMR